MPPKGVHTLPVRATEQLTWLTVKLLKKAQDNDTEHYDIQHNDIQHNDIQDNDAQHDDIPHNDTQHKGLIYVTQQTRLSTYMIEHNNTTIMLSIIMLSVVMMSVIMLSIVDHLKVMKSGFLRDLLYNLV